MSTFLRVASRSASAASAASAVLSMPRVDVFGSGDPRGNFVRNPLKVDLRSFERIARIRHLLLGSRGTLEKISLSLLVSDQQVVARESVAALCSSAPSSPVLVARIEDQDALLLLDGNHRAAAAFLGGEKKILARVLDLRDSMIRELEAGVER